jgi:hypothetical protein
MTFLILSIIFPPSLILITCVNGGVKFPICGGLKFPTLQFLVIEPNIVNNVRNGGMANDKRSAC